MDTTPKGLPRSAQAAGAPKFCVHGARKAGGFSLMPVRKLSVEDVAQLLEKHAAGTSLGDLAAEFDVSRQHVGRLVRARAANDGADADVPPVARSTPPRRTV